MAFGRAFRLDWTALAGYSAGYIQMLEGIGVVGVGVDRGVALKCFGDRDHRNQRDHREPRKAVAECGGAMSDS